MRIGASVGPFPENISEVPEEFDFVEFSIGEMEKDPDQIDIEKVREDLEQNDLDLIAHLPFRQPLVTGVDELDNANIEYLKRLLSVLSELDAEKAVIHVNNRYGFEQEELHLDELRTIMAEIDEVGQRKEIEIVFENVPDTNGNPAVTLHELGDIAEELGLSICFDTTHGFVSDGQEGIEGFLDQHMDKVSHLHVHDSIRSRDSHVAVGHGEIDWEGVGKRLSDFKGTATLEIYSNDMDYQLMSREKFLEFCNQNI